MIPRVIHYCWFGGKPLPEMAQWCLASWRKRMPDYEIVRWDEDNFDVYSVPYTAEAYRLGLYAFVSDYARLWILHHHGGIYLDTDVELLRPLDDMLARGPFMGQEQVIYPDGVTIYCAMGLGVACQAGHPFITRMLDHYRHTHFVSWTGRQGDTIVDITRRMLASEPIERLEDGIVRVAGFTVYPWPWLCPMNYFTGLMDIRPEAHAFHHYASSWVRDYSHQPLLQKLRRRLRASLTRVQLLIPQLSQRGG